MVSTIITAFRKINGSSLANSTHEAAGCRKLIVPVSSSREKKQFIRAAVGD
jgi:hypothetical protein